MVSPNTNKNTNTSQPHRHSLSTVLSMANQDISIDSSTLKSAMEAASSLNRDYSKEKQNELPRRLLNFEPNEESREKEEYTAAGSTSTSSTSAKDTAVKHEEHLSRDSSSSSAAVTATDRTRDSDPSSTTSTTTRPSLQSPEFKLKKNPVNTPEEYRHSAINSMYTSNSSLQGCTPLKMSPLDGRHYSQGVTSVNTSMNANHAHPHPNPAISGQGIYPNTFPYPSPANYYHKYPTQKYSPLKEEFQPSPQFENFDAFANNVLNSGGSDHYLMSMGMNSPWSHGGGVAGMNMNGMGSAMSGSGGGMNRRDPYDLHDQPIFNEHHDSPINIAKQQSRTHASSTSSAAAAAHSSSHHRRTSSSTSPAKYHTPIITSGNERNHKGESTAQTMSTSTASTHNYENYHDVSADQNHPMNYYHRPFGMRGASSGNSSSNHQQHPLEDQHISPAKYDASNSHHSHGNHHHHHHGHGHPNNTVYATPNFARSTDANANASSSDSSRMMPPATHSGNKYGVPNSTGSGRSNMSHPSQHVNHHMAPRQPSASYHDPHSSHASHLLHHPHGPPSASFHAPPSSHHHPHANYGAPPSHAPHSHDPHHHHHPAHAHGQHAHGPPSQHQHQQYPLGISPYHSAPGSSHPQQFGPGGVPPPHGSHGQFPSPYYNNFQMPNNRKRKKNDKPPGTKKQAKTAKRKKMYSDYVGVTYNKTHAKYQACITHYRKQHYLGRYKLACDAARSYDQAAVLLKGDSWKINFDSDEEYNTAREKEITEMIAKKKKDIEEDEEETKAFDEATFKKTLVVTFSSEESLKDKLGLNETAAPPPSHMQQHNMYAPPPSHMHHGGYNRPYSHPVNPYHGHPMGMNQTYGYAPPNSAEAPYSIMKPKAPVSGPVHTQPPQSHGMNSASKMTSMGPTAQGKLDPITPSPNAPALASNDTPAHSMMMSPNMNFMGTSPSANSILGNSMETPLSVLGSSVVKVKRESSTPKDLEHVSANMFASPDAIKGQNKSSTQNKPAHSEAVSALLEMSSTEKAPKPVQ